MEKTDHYHKKHDQSRNNIHQKINESIYSNPGTSKKAYDSERFIQPPYMPNRIAGDIIFFNFEKKLKNSIVMQLAATLIQAINLKSVDIKAKKTLGSEFYIFCLNNLLKTSISKAINDNELLTIYLKQLIIIIRNSDLYNSVKDVLSVHDLPLGGTHIYLKILDSFWNRSKWNEIFPSMPHSAIGLMKNKNVMINLLLKNKNKFRIAGISEEFANLTGIAKPNDLYLISFLDFYFFTWLSHFGIIKYVDGTDMEAVEIELTEHGRMILKYLLIH